ncbi:MAG TPA: hypothetical protein VLF66_14245, partial [Thermoanaerobaculia bacterium]|nr:hypothetical protein [Thermoanaerobaculia bacterium]
MGSAFLYETVTAYNAAGQPTAVDPPGYESAPTDKTTWSYTPDDPMEPDRSGLLPFARTDPIVGTTAFGYDALNRRVSVTDPSGVETTTGFDPLSRVTEVRQAASTAAEVVTAHQYDPFGQLLRTTLPRGNVIEYGYDGAGRLLTVERKPDAATPGERTRYVLDAAGNRTEEHLERWDAMAEAWETVSTTTFAYESRCRVGSITRGDGSTTPSTTHFAHDCNGNLERQWDANHPRFDPGTSAELPPTRTFGYDPLDRLVSVTEPWGGAGGGDAVTTYGFDAQDHLVAVTDAEGNTTTYEYSDRDLLTEEDSPASGVTTHAYNEHGELTQTTDARGVTVSRIVDAADRVTSVDYPDDALDTDFGYDAAPAACGGASFPLGRLGSITREGEAIEFCYDALGRRTRDGELTMSFDANGNRTGIGYPGNVSATYTFDFANREESLTVTTPSTLDHTVASGATYLPSGPLAAVTLGNGLTETRGFDERYHPAGIATAAPGHTWTYTTDAVGNVLGMTEIRPCGGSPLVLTDQTVETTETFESCASIEAGPGFSIVDPGNVTLWATERVVLRDGFSVGSGASLTVAIEPVEGTEEIERTYAYQDVQYFLTGADGPWGALDWTHDKIGNRLTEARDGGTPDTYVYTSNGTGNTPILDLINLGVGGTRDYTWGLAGHLEEVAAGANVLDFTNDDAGRLAGVSRDAGAEAADLLYDGRSYLASAGQTAGGSATVEPLYDSAGLLHALRRQASPTDPEELVVHFYLAGRPVAQVSLLDGAETWSYLTTDHLGTPLLATDSNSEVLWQGGFEPFGEDYQQGTPEGALANDIYLRLPGQWEDTSWQAASSGAGVFYNLWRWYKPAVGSYSRPDPINLGQLLNVTPLTGLPLFTEYQQANLRLGNPKLEAVYGYAAANPLGLTDPDGRVAPLICPLIPPALAALGKA